MVLRKANPYNPPKEGKPVAKKTNWKEFADWDIDGKPNRIGKQINQIHTRVVERFQSGDLDAQKVREHAKKLDMTLEEFVRFQELKSLACVEGVLTHAEGVMVYDLLGNTVGHFNKQPYEVKVVLTKLFAELLGWAACLCGGLGKGNIAPKV